MKRELVSFQGKCPLNCKHCYTTELYRPILNEVDRVVESTENADIIYVSHDYENFYNQDKGIELCKKLFEMHHAHLLIITRVALNDRTIRELIDLSEKMKAEGKFLIFSESIFAMQSYMISECCADPGSRIEVLNKMHDAGIPTILMLRPIFPKKYVKLDEYREILDAVKTNAVVTSGLIVTDGIIEKLGWKVEELNFGENLGSEYLSSLDPETVHYVNVKEEKEFIISECHKREIPCFSHSMEAVRGILGKV